jgi:SAM-dependent methyltransferase
MDLEERIKSFYISALDIPKKDVINFKGSAYGQLTYEGTEAMLEEFKEYFNNPDGVFYDLGCGPGHLLFHTVLKTNIGKAVGVERMSSRLDLGIEKLKANPDIKNVELVEGDFLKMDLSDATVVYIDNTAMPLETSTRVHEKIPTGCLILCAKRIVLNGDIKKTEATINRNYYRAKIHYIIKK